MNKINSIGIVGFGNMGQAIAEKLKSNYKIIIFDKEKSKMSLIKGILPVLDLDSLIKESDTIILAVKPQQFPEVFAEIKKCGHELDKLIISIAAGITTRYVEDYFGVVRVVRVMPNMPAKIGCGMTCLAKGRFASEEDFDLAEELFSYLGETLDIKEEMMNAATAISGSGPGYLYYLIEGRSLVEAEKYARNVFMPSLKEAAIKIGFNPDQARLLAQVTTEGSLAILKNSGLSAEQLKIQVASKGGTTEAGLIVLGKEGTIGEAAMAALKRAEELSGRK
ncbi:MAG: pyrroline-5-carboxylate reductase [Candidatus Omnitrophota bacterium]|jgi:pyrroline-5-carboxylate reductase